MILGEGIDLDAASARLARTGRVRLSGFLGAEEARRTHAAIDRPELPWQRSLDNPANVDVPIDLFEAIPADQRAELIKGVHQTATDGFQYLYDRYRLGPIPPDDEGLQPLFDVFDRLNDTVGMAFARALTGRNDIVHADAQATRYLPGHFLTGHDDRNDKTGRLYAYVLNLCPIWRAEWGGLLTFFEAGEVTDTFTPGFDVLNVFSVPQRHAVSLIAPFAGAPRYSITGWWRDRGPESWG